MVQSGTLHAVTVHFGLLNQGGTLAPGHSAGSTTILGTYTQQSAGRMEIEIGGTAPATRLDKVTVGGAASLGGTLDLRLINGFVPSSVQTFMVLDALSLTGGFANVASGQRVAVTAGGGSFAVHYGPGSPFDPTQVVLSDFGACVADVNGDRQVDLVDLAILLAHFGTPSGATLAEGDFDVDGDVDLSDLSRLLANFGMTCA